MAEARELWQSRKGFIYAAVGAAIGLGNLWRFPFQAYKNGGGAFFFPYIVALFTCAVPLMILEYHKTRQITLFKVEKRQNENMYHKTRHVRFINFLFVYSTKISICHNQI